MTVINKKIYKMIFDSFPILFLFIVVFTGFDLSFNFIFNVSFNFVYILIFYWVLKKPEILGFGLIFLAGIINDVLLNLPIGVTSVNYLLLCAVASFLRDRTLSPSIIFDWMVFFPSILVVNSIYFINLTLIFEIPISYPDLMVNSFFTFFVYPIFAKIFHTINLISKKKENA